MDLKKYVHLLQDWGTAVNIFINLQAILFV